MNKRIQLVTASLLIAMVSGCATQTAVAPPIQESSPNDRTAAVISQIHDSVTQIQAKAEQLARMRSESVGETRKPISEMASWVRTGVTPAPTEKPKVQVPNLRFTDGPTISVLAKDETAVSMARFVVSKIEGAPWRVEFVGNKPLTPKTVKFDNDTPISALARIKDITGVRMWINPTDRVVRISGD